MLLHRHLPGGGRCRALALLLRPVSGRSLATSIRPSPIPTERPRAYHSAFDLVGKLSSAAESSSLVIGSCLYSAALKLGLVTSNPFVAASVLNLYAKCCCFSEAKQLFDEIPEPNVVAWNTLIYAYAQSPSPVHVVDAFARMLSGGIPPNASTMSSVLVGCARLEDLFVGMTLHGVCLKRGFCSDVAVGTALVDAYAKCRDMGTARRVFDEMPDQNVITWTSLVTGCVLNRLPNDAMILVQEMLRAGIEVSNVVYNSIISSMETPKDLFLGKQVHCLIIREGFESDSYIAVTLAALYSRCGSRDDFVRTFPGMPTKDHVVCNSVIAGFTHFCGGAEVLMRFMEMRRECITVDYFTFTSVLKATGILSALEEGRQIHALILKTGNGSNTYIQNALISMYAKCGAINDSKWVFSLMEDLDLVSWNSLLAGFGQHGYGWKAVQLFEEMRRIGVKPNRTTFLSVLTSCSHAGLVEKGIHFFLSMQEEKSRITVGLEHYACVVDLLGRAGSLDQAESFANSLPLEPGISVFRALLNGCQVHGNMETAKRAAKCLFDLCPNDPSTHVLLANTLAAEGCWGVCS